MRIRKQGQTILGTSSSMPSTPPPPQLWVVPSTELPEAVLVCKLNQSPWDVVSYPPTPPRPDPEERPSYSKVDMGAMGRDGSARKKTGEKKGKKKVSMDENYTGGGRGVGATAAARKKRAAVAAVSLGSNMNDFYYYSVFGPRRGKRRGSDGISSTTEAKEKDEKAELEEEIVTWDFNNMDDSTDEGYKGKRRKLFKARSLKSLFK